MRIVKFVLRVLLVLVLLILSLVWLPAGIVLQSLSRGFDLQLDPNYLMSLAPVAPMGLLLVFPCWRLIRKGYRRLGIILLVILGGVSVFAVTLWGLLGPIGMLAAAAASSLPAWIVLVVTALRESTQRAVGDVPDWSEDPVQTIARMRK